MPERIGATPRADGRCGFRVWAPYADRVDVHVTAPDERTARLERLAGGYHAGVVDGVGPGARYRYRLDEERERPDPASRFQPRGVHGPSQVVEPEFPWDDACWTGVPLRDAVFYELHVGTYTDEGTFGALLAHLEALRSLGITVLELMPVAQFPGPRNWGYDGVYPYAVQNSYGGPAALKRLVNACHQAGLAVALDVVYNHLGPEGNVLGDFGPYFTDRYRTPWGAALNFDGPDSDPVRRFFIENALHWITEFHVDALRLDATHAILDTSALHFLEELTAAVHARADRLDRRVHVIAESARNDPRLLRPTALGGYGMDGQWNDDVHHALHALLTGETEGYYRDFGGLAPLARAWRNGFVYTGQYSPYRRRRHGRPPRSVPPEGLVVYAQNHDQVGNRMEGERLSRLVPRGALKLAAAAVLVSPYTPLLFMGEEYGETTPFPYFVSHSDPELVEAVRRGRREEFAAFRWAGEPPDPQAEATFRSAVLDHGKKDQPGHRTLLAWYRELLRLRREVPALSVRDREATEVRSYAADRVLTVSRITEGTAALLLLHADADPARLAVEIPPGRWEKRLDAAEPRWGGTGDALPERLGPGGRATLELPGWATGVYLRAG